MYGIYLTLGSLLLLAYVTWRASSVPRLRRVPRRIFLFGGAALGLLLLVGRGLGHDGTGLAARLLEFASMTMVGCLFLVFVCLFPVDLLLGFGRFFSRRAASARGWALLAGCALSLLALFQGLRPPLVVCYEVGLAGLPAALENRRLAVLSDLHLGSLIGPNWLRARVAQVRALRPDMILLLGDTFEGHGAASDDYLPALRGLSAPLGVWAVEGNHESHGEGRAGAGKRSEFPWRTLRDEVAEPAPGLFLAGRGQPPRHGRSRARPAWNPDGTRLAGALLLMSHVPDGAASAARAGVGLMLSGHTHGGQIWPLSCITRRVNPLLAGRYEIGAMTVLVSRGAGTWGPRMRLWRPGEILLVTLRRAARGSGM